MNEPMNAPLRALLLKLNFDLRLQNAILKAQEGFCLNSDISIVQASITMATITELERQISEVEKML